MTHEERERIRAAWDRLAEGYDQFVTPTHGTLGRDALRRAGLAEVRFLDVACGTGSLALEAARLGARVTATDLSPAMVEVMGRRAREAGFPDLDARVMDGCALELGDGTFDMAGSQFGVMLFPDLPAGLREMARVTRPGGTVLLIAFGPPGGVEFITFMMAAMKAVVPGFTGLPTDPPPLPFQVADPDVLHRQLAGAGLRDVRVERTREELTFASGDDLWTWLMNSNPIPGQLVADLTGEQKAAVRGELERMVRERAGDGDAAVLHIPIHIGIGTK